VETISISQLPSTQFDSIRFQTDPPCWDFALRFLAVHVCGMNKPTYLIAIPGTGFPWYIFLNSLELNHNSGLGLALGLRPTRLLLAWLWLWLWPLRAIGKCNRCYIFFFQPTRAIVAVSNFLWPANEAATTTSWLTRKAKNKKRKEQNTPDVFHKQHFDYDDAGAQTQIDVFIWKLNQSQVPSSEYPEYGARQQLATCVRVLGSGQQCKLCTGKCFG